MIDLPALAAISTAAVENRPTIESVVPSPSTRARVIALMNQKGGVGKTTSVVGIGAALAESGQRVLMVDLDPQAHLTLHLGVDPAGLEGTVYDLMTNDEINAANVLQSVKENIALLPAEVNLAGVETELAPQMVTGRAQRVLKEKTRPLFKTQSTSNAETKPTPDTGYPIPPFDFCLIDCPPSLGLLTINALTMAREILVPMQAHFLALQGLSKLFETVSLVSQSFNRDLTVTGVILCMHESQTILASEVVADLRSFLEADRDSDVPWRDAQILDPPVRRNIKLAECPGFGQTIFDYAPGSHGAKDYRSLARSLLDQHTGQ